MSSYTPPAECTKAHGGNRRIVPAANGYWECCGCGSFYGDAPTAKQCVPVVDRQREKLKRAVAI